MTSNSPKSNATELILTSLSSLYGNLSVYKLTAGALNSTNDQTQEFIIDQPAFYLTNFSNFEQVNFTLLNELLDDAQTQLASLLQNKEVFTGGVVSMCFVLSGITTASWLLLLLLLLSANTLPNSLILANLFHSVGHSVILQKLTNVLQVQVRNDYSDNQQIQNLVTSSTALIIVKGLTSMFIYVSWIDLLIQINRYEERKKILVIGSALSGMAVITTFLYGFFFRNMDQVDGSYTAIKVLHFLFEFLILFIVQLQLLLFSIKKRKFAYHRRSMALSVFSWLVLLEPYIFLIIDLVSDRLRTWSTYVVLFGKLCISIVVWEWLYTIRSLEIRDERKTVLGRRISNDSFTQDPKPGAAPDNYILKSLNIVALISELRRNILKQISKPKFAKKEVLHQQDVSLYEMVPMTSTESEISEQISAISLVGDYPQFDVDHRYLRNTPSTLRDTPLHEENGQESR